MTKMSLVELINLAESYGFFRSQDQDEQTQIILEIQDEFADELPDDIETLLAGEIETREAEKAKSKARNITRKIKARNKPLTGGTSEALGHVKAKGKGRYVLTVAQNNTEVDAEFFGALKTYAEYMGAEILIAPCTYNKAGFQQPAIDHEDLYFVKEVEPYLCTDQLDLGGVHFVGHANVIPTAKNPLSGFEAVTPVGIDVVIPAVKISLKCTARLKNGKGKIMWSTGAVTQRNYIVRKAGAVAATEHNIGAIFVDTTGDLPIMRNIERIGNDAGFYDNGVYFTDNDVKHSQRPVALQFGDIHAEKMTMANLEKCVAAIQQYNPHNIIVHDLLDFSSRNHHNVKDCSFVFEQTMKENTVRKDLQTMARVLDTLTGESTATVHVIESNHDLAINTWLKNEDFKKDPINAVTYLECMLALYKHKQRNTDTDFNMLAYAYKKIGNGKYAEHIQFHETDESVIIAGVEMGCHGHVGINGSRGSPAQFRTLGIAMNTGHTHTPSIQGACYTAGVTGSLEMGYNVGPSSWQLANIVTWPNGQRQIIFM